MIVLLSETFRIESEKLDLIKIYLLPYYGKHATI